MLKYANTSGKSPRKLSQVKSDLNIFQAQNQQPQRNMDIKEICREYAENKKNGKNVYKEAPVWKFSSKHDSEQEEDNYRSNPTSTNANNRFAR